eukprot:15332-Eustigmatos_ZCMA.PRE.1
MHRWFSSYRRLLTSNFSCGDLQSSDHQRVTYTSCNYDLVRSSCSGWCHTVRQGRAERRGPNGGAWSPAWSP